MPLAARENVSPHVLTQKPANTLPLTADAKTQSGQRADSSGPPLSAQELSLIAVLSHGDLATLKGLNGFGPKTAATFMTKRPASGFSCLQDLVSQGLVTPRILDKLKTNL
jgi:DNA uptake protein ComE-like DNA-binding protein